MRLFEEYVCDLDEASMITFDGMTYPKEGWCVIMAGASGSGKGYMQNHNILIDAKVFDIDKISTNYSKAAASGKIKDDNHKYDLKNSDDVTALHDTVKRKRLNWKAEDDFFAAINKKHLPNILFDITGKVPNDIIEKFEKIKDYGYKVSFVWVVANRNVAMDRNIKRDRVVGQEWFHKIHNNAASALPKWITTEQAGSMFDEMWLLYSSSKKREKDMTSRDKERLADSCAVKLEKKGNKFFLSDKGYKKLVNTLGPLEINPENPKVYDTFDKRKSEMHESASGFDQFIDYRSCYNRLKSEYNKYGKLIIAVDFDDTLCSNGRANTLLLDLIKRWQDHAYIVIWTSRTEGMYAEVNNFIEREGLNVVGINVDVEDFGSRKMYANVYVDDRAGLPTTFQMLSELIEEIESQNI